jgi:phenylpropionate dioxygenase-like ring-hydroxylating dioxygenase large terminal subunit
MQIVSEPADLFNPAHYAQCRRAVEVAETLPPWCYTSQEFYERERERIFLKTWNCVGHVSRVPNPGSYVTETFVDIPLVIVRGEDGVIRCFVNACRHRGGEVAFGSGECKMLKCPYHTWTYALTGELVGIPLFEESDVFKKADYGLTPVRLETWAGFMWINFDAEAENLHSYLGDLPERVAPYRAEDMAMVSHTTYHIEANWKQYYENFSDPYHVPFVHRSTLNFKPVSRRQLHDPAIYKGNYVMHRAWFEGTRGVMPGEKIFPAMELPEDLQGAFYPWVYPNTGMGFAVDCVFEVEMYPEGPEHIRLERSFLVPKACQGVPDYEEILANYLRAQDQVQKEDIEILEMQQRSVHSPLYKTGRFARMDKLVHGCENWVLDRVIGNAP